MRTRKNARGVTVRFLTATMLSAAMVALPAAAEQYARAIGEPAEPETRPAPRPAPAPAPTPAPAKKPPERAPTRQPTPPEPTAAADEEGGNSSYIWIGLGVAAALAVLGGGGGGGGGGSTPSH